MKNILKRGSVIAIAAAMVAGGVTIGQTFAAVGIDTESDCSITFAVDSAYEDLDVSQVPVSVYKLASVDVGGRYTALPGFTSLDVADISSESTAAFWQDMAKDAYELIGDATDTNANDDGTFSATIDGLETGLYLVVPGGELDEKDVLNDLYTYGVVETWEHVYEFTPYVVALPYNYYYSNKNDDWVYDLDSTLKAAQNDRFGSVTLSKTLEAYDATLKNGTFSFNITATNEEGEVVYSNEAGFTFTAAGTQSVTFNSIPVGATVTITENASGTYDGTVIAPFVLGENENKVVEIVNDKAAATNTPSNRLIEGDGVVNHYTYSPETGFSVIQNEKTDGTEFNKTTVTEPAIMDVFGDAPVEEPK